MYNCSMSINKDAGSEGIGTIYFHEHLGSYTKKKVKADLKTCTSFSK